MSFRIVFYKEDDGSIPIVEWIESIESAAQTKVLSKIDWLKVLGNELRRPSADYLRDGIYELRIQHRRIQYRVLYFIHGTSIIVLSHGLRKTDLVPCNEIEKALKRKMTFLQDPESHSSEGQT